MPEETKAERSGGQEPSGGDRPKRRRWLRRLIILLVLLVLLVAAAPYGLSTGPVVRLVTSFVSDGIHGRLDVEEVSLAWFGPCRIRGVRVTDVAGRDVLRVERIEVPGGLARRIASGEAFDEVEVTAPAVTLYRAPDGTISLVEALSPREPREPDEEDDEDTRLPEPRGTLIIRDASVRVVQPDGRKLELSSIHFRTDIETLGRIAGSAEVRLGAGGALSAEFELSDLVEAGRLRPAGATGRLTIRTAEAIDAAPLSGFALDGTKVAGDVSIQADVSLEAGQPAGRFQVDVAGLRAASGSSQVVTPLDVRLAGSATVADNTVRGRVDLTSSCGRLGATFRYRAADKPVEISTEDLLAAVLSGQRIELPDVALDANGQIDLPKLARAVPALLRIRPDVSVTSGIVRVDDVALRGGSQASARGKIVLENVSARSGDRTVRWLPASIDFDARLVPGKGLEARQVRAEAGFGSLQASGRADNLQVAYRADLAKLRKQLAEVFDLGDMTLAGIAEGKLSAAVGRDERVAIQLDSALRAVRWGQGERRLATQATTLTVRGELAHKDGEDVRLSIRRAALNLDDEVILTASGLVDVSRDAFDANATLQRCLLAGMSRRASGLGIKDLPAMAGELVGTVTVGRKPAGAVVSSGSLRVVGGRLNGKAIGDKPVRIDFTDVRANAETGAVGVASAAVTSDAATVTVRDVDVQTAKHLRFAGKADVTADLARCAALAAALAGEKDPADVAGRVTWSGTADGKLDGSVALVGSGTVAELVVGSGSQAVRVEPLTFRQDVRIDPATEAIDVKSFRLDSDLLALSAAGHVRRYATDVLLDIRGHYRGDWQRLMDVAHRLAPDTKDVALTGPIDSDFVLAGPASRPKLTPTFHDMQAQAGVGWASARYAGFSLGAAKLPVRLAGGRIEVLPVTAVDASGGTVRLGGAVDLTGQTPVLHLPGEITVVENVPINREVAQALLSRFNPIFGHLVSVAGRITLATRDLALPLGPAVKKGGSGTGRLDLSEMKVQPGGVLTTLLGLGGIPPERAQIMDVGSVDFAVRGGAIHYENFTVTFDKTFDLKFRGAVRFDDGLDMVVSVPVRSALLRRLGVRGQVDEYARMLEGARVDVPLVGTRLAPKVDLDRVDIRPLVTKAAERLLSEKAGNMLGDLLKGRGGKSPDAGSQPTSRPGPATRPVGPTPAEVIQKGVFDLLGGLLKPKGSPKTDE